MQFFGWTTDYQLYRKQLGRNALPYEQYLPSRAAQQRAAGLPTYRLEAERAWDHEGNPYYNIHPQMVSRLCRVDMAKIPSRMLVTPHGLKTVNIRLAEQHEEFTLKEEQHTDFTAKLSNTTGTVPPGSFAHSILMIDLNPSIGFIIDFNVFTPLGQPVYTMFGIMRKEGASLEDAINEAKGQGRSPSYIAVIENVMRLCASVGFLASNPTICEPDVLAKDRREFEEADDTRRKFLADRARRKGKHGYNVGTDLMFLGARPQHRTGRQTIATERELEYAHIRSGHPHLVRYGEKKELVKLMWYVPTTVRPDKPFKKD